VIFVGEGRTGAFFLNSFALLACAVMASLTPHILNAQTELGAIKEPGRTLSFYGMESGRFEVAAMAGPEGAQLGSLAEQVWPVWQNQLGLPERWPVGITVRLAPAETWPSGSPSWRVTTEAAGVVSLWIRARTIEEPEGLTEQRRLLRALADAALHRQAVFKATALDKITVPAWLSIGAAEAVLIRRQPALSDAWQQEVKGLPHMPPLHAILSPQDPAPAAAAAYAVWLWLQTEGARSGGWRVFLSEVLAGADALKSITLNYENRLGRVGNQELELAWQTGCANLVRVKIVPVMEPAESRLWLGQLTRSSLHDATQKTDIAVDLTTEWDHRQDTEVRKQRDDRINLLASTFHQIHPFYRNAAGSLGRLWLAMDKNKQTAWKKELEEWRRDTSSGLELEKASARILDKSER
jgi:hypothetical protein